MLCIGRGTRSRKSLPLFLSCLSVLLQKKERERDDSEQDGLKKRKLSISSEKDGEDAAMVVNGVDESSHVHEKKKKKKRKEFANPDHE